MANATKGFQNDNRANIGASKESLWNVMVQIRADETYVSSHAPISNASDMIHMWATKTPRPIGPRAAVQGADPSFDNTNTARSQNWTQLFEIGYELTGSNAAATYPGTDPLAQEKDEAINDAKDFLEYALVRGTMVCGNDSTASSMKGLKAWASTLKTVLSAITLTEAIANRYMANGWAQGTKLTTWLASSALKDRINTFSGGATRQVDANTESIYGNIDVIKTSYGTVTVNLHRFITADTDTNQDFLLYDSRYIHLAEYRAFKFKPLAETGDATRGMVVGEYTLQVDTEKAVALATNHV